VEQIRRLAGQVEHYVELFTGLACEHRIHIVAGSIPLFEDGRLTNRSFVFGPGGDHGVQGKLHMTRWETEEWNVEGSESLRLFDTDKGKVSIQICYDVEFPEVSRLAVERGARIVFVPFCTDERQGYLRVRYCAQARCIENQIYAAISGTVGNLPVVENMDIQYAQSGIFTPSDFSFSRDAVGAECTPNIETVVIHDVDLELLERFRQKGTVRNWIDRRTDIYEVRARASGAVSESEPVPEGAPLGRPVGG
jgi:predicted amidohydrolase